MSNPQSNLEQRLWVKEQEVSALKVQNRHLLAKLEEAEKTARPNQINTSLVAADVQKSLQPVIQELENSIKGAFDILQSTMRGIYQQSQRCQQAVEEMGAHTRDLEVRVHEQRKADQLHFQEKVMTSVSAFCDRMERQIENRLKSLSMIDLMNSKQNEMLSDVDQMKSLVGSMQKISELNRTDMARIERESNENSQKLLDVQMQTRNAEEIARDVLQQISNHRSEFKLLRGELKSIFEVTKELKNFEELREQKTDLKRIAKETETQLRNMVADEAQSELVIVPENSKEGSEVKEMKI